MIWPFLADNLPHLTAFLNLSATVLLALGLYRIKHGQVRRHKSMMLAALMVSAVFLLSYLLHKVALYETTGAFNKRFPARYSDRSTGGSVHVLCHLIHALASGDLGPVPGCTSGLVGQTRTYRGTQAFGSLGLSDLDVRVSHRCAGLPDAVSDLSDLVPIRKGV